MEFIFSIVFMYFFFRLLWWIVTLGQGWPDSDDN